MKDWKNHLAILLGSLVFALSLNYFIIANQLAEGGVTGVSLIIHYLTGFPVGLAILGLNIPIFALGWRELGRTFAFRTVLGVAAVSVFVDVTVPLLKLFQPPPSDLLLAALFGGAASGLGLGLIFRAGGSTGGVDIVAQIAHHRYGVSIGRVMFTFDAVVLTAFGLLFNRNAALYSLVAMFVASRVIDSVQEGAYTAKAVTIISDNPQPIVRRITSELERGVTLLKGEGGFTGSPKEVLYCVVNRNEMARLKTIVHSEDPRAFVIVSDAREVLGEGFRGPG